MSSGSDGIVPAFALAFADAPTASCARVPRAPIAAPATTGSAHAQGASVVAYATRHDVPPPDDVAPALEHAVWVERGDERAPAPPEGGDARPSDPDGIPAPATYTRPLSPEAVNHLARRFGVPSWLGGTRAEADLVEAHQRTCDVAAEFKALSAGALSLRATVRRIQGNVLAARFAPVDALPVAVALLSAQRVVSANAALARLLGYDRAAIEGASWRDLLGADAAPLEGLFALDTDTTRADPQGSRGAPAEPGRAALSLRVRVPHPDGTARFYAVEASPARHGLAYCVVRADDAAPAALAPTPPVPHTGAPTE